MNSTLSPVTAQRIVAMQTELIGLVEQDYAGLTCARALRYKSCSNWLAH